MARAFRIFAAVIALIGGGLSGPPAHACMTLTGAGGVCGGGAAPAYTGPGDVYGAAFAYWGLRCFNSAYAGNVADVYAPSDASHTLITCSTGGILNQTLQPLATTCATSCTVKTLYDQTAGAYGDMATATEAARPTFNVSGINGKFTITFTSSQQLQTATGLAGHNQPATFSMVAMRPSSAAALKAITDGLIDIGVGYANAVNSARMSSGATNLDATASDGHFHALQYLFNTSSSNLNVDGSNNIGNIGTANPVFQDRLGLNLGFSAPGAFSFAETGVWLSDKTASFGAMNTNQAAYWGPF